MQFGIPKVLYEDNHLIFVYKPHGWLVHGDHTGDSSLGDWLKQYIKAKYNKPGEVFLGTIHRLDRPVGGVMVFARTSKALERMNKLFADKTVSKVYRALVSGKKPEHLEATMINWLRKDENKNRVEVSEIDKGAEWKKAETKYKVIGAVKNLFEVELNPLTGRSHQLRAQLANIGLPIAGDLKYGSKIKLEDGNIALQCISLSFAHPVTKEHIEVRLNKIKWSEQLSL